MALLNLLKTTGYRKKKKKYYVSSQMSMMSCAQGHLHTSPK